MEKAFSLSCSLLMWLGYWQYWRCTKSSCSGSSWQGAEDRGLYCAFFYDRGGPSCSNSSHIPFFQCTLSHSMHFYRSDAWFYFDVFFSDVELLVTSWIVLTGYCVWSVKYHINTLFLDSYQKAIDLGSANGVRQSLRLWKGTVSAPFLHE